MDLADLISGLSRSGAYPHPAGTVRVAQTHASVVFLAGEHAYKVKKPVDLGFLDFSTLEKRRACCEAEVRLNRRLAPDVYLGVVPITATAGGAVVGGAGDPIEYAVHMRRLDQGRHLAALLERGELDGGLLERVAARLAAFHAAAAGGPEVAASASFPNVAGNCLDNYALAGGFVGDTISRAVLERARALTAAELERRRPLIEARAGAGVPRDGHGDLRLEHVYHFPDEPPPRDLVVIDCVEFNDRLRRCDPVSDIAFLGMELEFHRRPELARAFTDAWFRSTRDDEGRALLPLYTSYRHAVRGKVRSLQAHEEEVAPPDRERARQRARAHFLLALGRLAPPGEKPCLVLAGGLPGTGKSTLARRLEAAAGFERISSDATRKRLAGIGETTPAGAPFGEGLYTPAWDERTYGECLLRATSLLFEGRRVLVDASFREERRRRAFLQAADDLGVPAIVLLCEAGEATARRRLADRTGDASDAGWEVYRAVAACWEAPGPETAARSRRLSTEGSTEQTVAAAQRLLANEGLA
jgi:hypothetical protein